MAKTVAKMVSRGSTGMVAEEEEARMMGRP
jgi:hypothetical protein